MLRFFASILLCSQCWAAPLTLNSDAQPIDQIPIHEYGCGPISLLNSYRFSSKEWQQVTSRYSGAPEDAFKHLTRKFGRRVSPYVYGNMRWNDKSGMQSRDLHDLINAFHKKLKLPPVSFTSLFLKKDETHEQLMLRVEQEINNSIKNGFPPLLSLGRYAKRTSHSGSYRWAAVSSHFVSVINATKLNDSLQLIYVDPWGGRQLTGTILLPSSTFYASDLSNRKDKNIKRKPSLVADFPFSSVGAHLLSDNTPNALIPAHLIVARKAPDTAQ